MKIYNFFDGNGSTIGIVITLITIVCLAITIRLIVHYIKGKKRNAVLLYKLVSIAPIIIMLSITILFSIHAFRVGRLHLPALTGKEKTVVGELTQVDVTRNDYRGEKQYDITFKVNDFEFEKTYNTYSESEMAEILKNQGCQVKVTYTERNDTCTVYTIETILD